jgi:chromosome segregation ATPase
MDWERIEKEVHYQTQAIVAFSSRGGIPTGGVGYGPSAYGPPFGRSATRESKEDIFIRNNSSGTTEAETGELERALMELRADLQQQSRRTAILEKMLGSYNEILESSSSAQAFVSERMEQIDHELKNSIKFVMGASRDKSELSIQIKTLSGKVEALQEHLQGSAVEYATKDSFSQLLDSTVEQIRSLDVAIANARSKSAQSSSLVEAVIQAISQLKDVSSSESEGIPGTMNLDFLSKHAGYAVSDVNFTIYCILRIVTRLQ